jgi:hypothetical protein
MTRNERRSAAYAANREECAARQRAWYNDNKEHVSFMRKRKREMTMSKKEMEDHLRWAAKKIYDATMSNTESNDRALEILSAIGWPKDEEEEE